MELAWPSQFAAAAATASHANLPSIPKEGEERERREDRETTSAWQERRLFGEAYDHLAVSLFKTLRYPSPRPIRM